MTNTIIEKEYMNIVIVGHVDHGKSTIIGRLMADTGSLPDGKLEQVRENCRSNSKPFEYAFLLDALKDEQSQGITIDTARCFFNTAKRDYIIIDAPGHIEFLKNMITGAARAEAALLVIDVNEGVKENSTRHGYMLSMLGIKQVAVLINKMDLANYDEAVYNSIINEYGGFLNKINIMPSAFIPVSGAEGVNIASQGNKTPWYNGVTVLEILDKFETQKPLDEKPFRMPVQDIYKFTRDGDNRRIVAGTIETGTINAGDKLIFYPSGKASEIKTIESFNSNLIQSISAGYATGFTLKEQIYIKRGEIACIEGQARPKTTTRVKGSLFWLGKKPMTKSKDYFFKIGTAKISVRIEEIISVMDASSLANSQKQQIDRHDVAEVILKLERATAFDLADNIPQLSRFVIVDDYEISGGGIIQEALDDKESWVRDKVIIRNYRWEKSIIPQDERAEKYNQKATLVLITGSKGSERKIIAKTLEKKLFDEGKHIYYLGIGNTRYGVDADIVSSSINNREEHMRRLGEVANIMLDAGLILIVTANEIGQNDLDIIRTIIDHDKIETVWLGETIAADAEYSLHIPYFTREMDAALAVKGLLLDKGRIFKVN